MTLSHPLSSGQPRVSAVRSWLSAALLVLLVPFAILLIGLPIALAIRGVVEGLRWIGSMVL